MCNPAFNGKPFWPSWLKPALNVTYPFANPLRWPGPVRHLHYYDEMQISLKDTSGHPAVRRPPSASYFGIDYTSICVPYAPPYLGSHIHVLHIPPSSVAFVYMYVCVILMQITFPVFELQLVGTCVCVCGMH